jgi:hypothetical protein
MLIIGSALSPYIHHNSYYIDHLFGVNEGFAIEQVGGFGFGAVVDLLRWLNGQSLDRSITDG